MFLLIKEYTRSSIGGETVERAMSSTSGDEASRLDVGAVAMMMMT